MNLPPPARPHDPVAAAAGEPLLEVARLRVSFRDESGAWHAAVHGVDFQVQRSRTVALVGESGSGKSVSALATMGLLPPRASRVEAGSVLRFGGRDLLALSAAERRALRGGRMGMVFQEPMSSLNPVFRVGDQVAEVLRLHRGLGRRAALERAEALLAEVGMPDPAQRLRAFPHQLSGGQQQRVMIAMALACEPELLIADEPTTALDVTIQRQILELLAGLKARHRMALLFITHDLGVVSDIADDVVVMRHGRVREQGPAARVLRAPADDYTRALLNCRPPLDRRPARLAQVEDLLGAAPPAAPPPATAMPAGNGLASADGQRSGGRGVASGSAPPLLEVRGLCRRFTQRQGLFGQRHHDAVQDLSFSLRRGETLAVVGESGSGKTTLGLALMHLQPATAGQVLFDGQALDTLDERSWREVRRRMQIVFQNPYASLNPRFTIAQVLAEPFRVHGLLPDPRARQARMQALLHEVGLDASALRRYPHEFSGGQRQRIAIARCLALEPELLVLDESVSALDVSVQAQVLNLLRGLQERLGLAYLFITHDLGVVRFIADRVLVMQSGRAVELCPADELFDGRPHHPYTERLLAAIPGRALTPTDR